MLLLHVSVLVVMFLLLFYDKDNDLNVSSTIRNTSGRSSTRRMVLHETRTTTIVCRRTCVHVCPSLSVSSRYDMYQSTEWTIALGHPLVFTISTLFLVVVPEQFLVSSCLSWGYPEPLTRCWRDMYGSLLILCLAWIHDTTTTARKIRAQKK